jgi:hypothetical protein
MARGEELKDFELRRQELFDYPLTEHTPRQ